MCAHVENVGGAKKQSPKTTKNPSNPEINKEL